MKFGPSWRPSLDVFLTNRAHKFVVSLAAVFWMSRNAPPFKKFGGVKTSESQINRDFSEEDKNNSSTRVQVSLRND